MVLADETDRFQRAVEALEGGLGSRLIPLSCVQSVKSSCSAKVNRWSSADMLDQL